MRITQDRFDEIQGIAGKHMRGMLIELELTGHPNKHQILDEAALQIAIVVHKFVSSR